MPSPGMLGCRNRGDLCEGLALRRRPVAQALPNPAPVPHWHGCKEAKIAVGRLSERDAEEGCRLDAPEATDSSALGFDDDMLAGWSGPHEQRLLSRQDGEHAREMVAELDHEVAQEGRGRLVGDLPVFGEDLR